MTFVGNHDVTRIASRLTDERHVGHALALMLTIGGTPSVYAGDEWAYRGVKEERFGGDDAVRPEFPARPGESEHLGHDAFRLHQHLIGLRRRHPWLHAARTSALHLANSQYVYRTVSRRRDRWWSRSTSTTRRCGCRCPSSGIGSGRVVAGSGVPPEDVVDRLDVEPHGWAVLTV